MTPKMEIGTNRYLWIGGTRGGRAAFMMKRAEVASLLANTVTYGGEYIARDMEKHGMSRRIARYMLNRLRKSAMSDAAGYAAANTARINRIIRTMTAGMDAGRVQNTIRTAIPRRITRMYVGEFLAPKSRRMAG